MKTELTADIIFKMFAETDKKMQETSYQMQETDKKLNKFIESQKRQSKQLGGISNNIGHATEDYFYLRLKKSLEVSGIKYYDIRRNLIGGRKGKQAEFDILLINKTRLLLIEVKQNFHEQDIEKFVNKQIPLFKDLFREYSQFDIYSAVAGMSFSSNSKKSARKNNLLMLTQSEEGIIKVLS